MQNSAYSKQDQNNLIYIYDLPKSVTSVQIAKTLKEEAGVDFDMQPQIRRDIGRHFYTAIIKLKDAESCKKVQEKLRYPMFIVPSKQQEGE